MEDCLINPKRQKGLGQFQPPWLFRRLDKDSFTYSTQLLKHQKCEEHINVLTTFDIKLITLIKFGPLHNSMLSLFVDVELGCYLCMSLTLHPRKI